MPDSLECLQCAGHLLAGSARLERKGRENPGPVTQASLRSPSATEGPLQKSRTIASRDINKPAMAINHTLNHSFIDQSIAISGTTASLCWSNFRIVRHALVFKIQKCFHDVTESQSHVLHDSTESQSHVLHDIAESQLHVWSRLV